MISNNNVTMSSKPVVDKDTLTDTPGIFYKNNPLIRNQNVTYSLSKEELLEIIKCSNDAQYFIENYVKVLDLDKGLVPMKLYEPQKRMLAAYVNDTRVITLASRRSGKTATTAAFLVWYVIFHADKPCAILANKQKLAVEILDTIKKMYEHLPFFIQQGVTVWNRTLICFENGSKIMASATSSSAVRGFGASVLYIDEMAFVPHNIAEEFFTSVIPIVASGKTTKLFLTSTPNGFNLFHTYWKEAIEGKNGYTPIEMHWSEIPGRDEAWKQRTIRDLNGSEDRFLVEYDNQFSGSDRTLIPARTLRTLSADTPIKSSQNVDIYKLVEEGHKYMLVADPARGTGNDSSAFIVFDVTEYPIRIVAKYKSEDISPQIFPIVIERIARQYNSADVLVEINDNGKQVADILYYDLEYENTIALSYKEGAGIRTTHPIKRRGCSTFRDLVETSRLIVNDEDLIAELTTFIAKKQGYEADKGHHDDLVMCCVLFSWFSTTPQFMELKDMDIRRKIQEDKRNRIIEDIGPFGIVFRGNDVITDIENPNAIHHYDDDHDRIVVNSRWTF